MMHTGLSEMMTALTGQLELFSLSCFTSVLHNVNVIVYGFRQNLLGKRKMFSCALKLGLEIYFEVI